MTDAGLKPVLHHGQEYDRQSSHELARTILAAPERPSAIFATYDLAGISILRVAADLGLSGPATFWRANTVSRD